MFRGDGKPLSEDGVREAASRLGVELPALWAVMAVETKGCGFLPDRRPLVLFERHVFHRRTGGRFDQAAPDLSAATAGGYGPGGSSQHDRLARAVQLDRKAALESASWGLGQVMGFNAATAGFSDAEAMVVAMCESEDRQFGAMVAFIDAKGLAGHLQRGDWAKFAFYYNGSEFQKNKYDTNLAKAHARFIAGPLPNLRVRAAQLYLNYLGYGAGTVDGWYGEKTQRALIRFQKAKNLPSTGQVDQEILELLESESFPQ